MTIIKEVFLEKYKTSIEEFEDVSLDWDLLLGIFKDYQIYRQTLIPTAENIATILRLDYNVHSVRTRVKDSEHLLDKIIRKTIKVKKKDPESDYVITIENYKTEITDLIGIRVLHLYKDQAEKIDMLIRGHWDLQETATVYYREGDYSRSEIEDKAKDEDFDFEVHPAGYRSWHYLINAQLTREPHISEIQVRTIFEEGWSEIDHQLRYPNDIGNVLLTEQLLVLNRIAGSADEMANTIRETKKNINSLILENVESQKLIDGLNEQLEKLLKENEIKDADKKALKERMRELQESRYTSGNLLGENYMSDAHGSVLIEPHAEYKVKKNNYLGIPTMRNFGVEKSTIVYKQESPNHGLLGNKYLAGYTYPEFNIKDE